MQQVIGRYLFDTNKSTQKARADRYWYEYSYGRSPQVETLYLTKNGRWFLHKEMKMRRWFSRETYVVSEELYPMQENEVYDWCRETDTPPQSIGLKAWDDA